MELTNKITLVLKDHTIELTQEEARELYGKLILLLNIQDSPYIPDFPYAPYPTHPLPNWPNYPFYPVNPITPGLSCI